MYKGQKYLQGAEQTCTNSKKIQINYAVLLELRPDPSMQMHQHSSISSQKLTLRLGLKTYIFLPMEWENKANFIVKDTLETSFLDRVQRRDYEKPFPFYWHKFMSVTHYFVEGIDFSLFVNHSTAVYKNMWLLAFISSNGKPFPCCWKQFFTVYQLFTICGQ